MGRDYEQKHKGNEWYLWPRFAVQVDAHQPGHRLDHEVMPRHPRKRPRLPVAADRAIDDPGVDALRVLVVDGELLGHARPEGFEHHIRFLEQAVRDGASLRLRQVQRQPLLVAVDAVEVDAALLVLGRIVAAVVADSRLFDLDHMRAHIGEQLRTPRPRQQPAEIRNDNAVERQRGCFVGGIGHVFACRVF